MARPSLLLPPLLCVLVLAGCGGGGSGASTSASGCESAERPPAEPRQAPRPTESLDPSATYDVRIETNCGDFTIRLDQRQSPNATASFASLVEKGFFDDTIFHRIVPGFVIQGGDPTATGTGGPGYTTEDTPPRTATYTHGTVAMAKTAVEPPGTAGSQFFIVTADDAGLPADYAIVGQVTDGLDVVDRIGELGDPGTEQPTETVVIESATVETT